MPRLSGFEVLEKISKHKVFGAISVWAFSANSDSESRAKCTKVGFDGFLAKPIMRGDVQFLVNSFMSYQVLIQL